jgi:uncharacterized protein (TIGR03032 family)
MSSLEKIFEAQGNAARNPIDIISNSAESLEITSKSLKFEADEKFKSKLNELGISLIISREYENLVLSISPTQNGISQSFFPLAHPSGIAYNQNEKSLIIASTRNPNRIIEFKKNSDYLSRLENKFTPESKDYLIPIRSKNYPGAYYFHDLDFIDNQLYANSVGQNGIVKINLNSADIEDVFWQPNIKSADLNSANFIQLNSIAKGKTFEDSFFSASTENAGNLRPGHKNFKVDNQGVIFSAKSGKVIAKGLTRPHSARQYNNELYVLNSGYGEFGIIKNQKFHSLKKFDAWTRGLFFYENYAFIGLSRVLPKFIQYAPGIKQKKQECAIEIINLNTLKSEGKIKFPNGNQIFQIIGIQDDKIKFPYSKIRENKNLIKSIFYKFKIDK